MSSKKEEERNEKIIRGLLKLPPNRKCINCNSLGPQYVCTNFWTFVCVTCSGIHREFTHRVKSVSMAKFTSQEVEALQKGGNQRARENLLSDWDSERMRLPDSGNVSKIREFIKSVYVDKKYADGKSSGKPPRDMQNHKNHEEHKRASSYHSFSQSPPYEDQYEERRYGKQSGMLSRKPGSDHGRYESKMSSFINSPGHRGEEAFEDRFSNETPGSRNSDYSNMSPPFRPDGQSPKLGIGHTSPPYRPVRDILIEDSKSINPFHDATVKKDIDVSPSSKRTASSSSFGSLDSNSSNLVDTKTNCLTDIVPVAELVNQNSVISPASGSLAISSANTGNQDFFNLHVLQKQAVISAPSPDLFSSNPELPSITSSTERQPAYPCSESVGWATFDLPHQETWNAFGEHIANGPVVTQTSVPRIGEEQLSGPEFCTTEVPDKAHKEPVKWNGFSDPVENVPHATHLNALKTDEQHVFVPHWPTIDHNTAYKASEVDAVHYSVVNDFTILGVPSDSLTTPSVPSSTIDLKEGTTLERKSTNPFDFFDDFDVEENNVFLDMSSLQSVLPSSELPNDLHDDFSQSWYPQNPATFVSSIPQGGLAYMAGQLPGSPLREFHSQGPVAPVSANPFL